MSTDNPFDAPGASYEPSFEYPLGDREPAELTVEGILSRSWLLFTEQPGVIIGTILISFAVGLIFGVPRGVLQFMAEKADSPQEATTLGLVMLSLQLISFLVTLFVTLGSIRVFSEVASGNEAQISMVFGEGGRYLSGLGTNILLALIVFVGLLLFIAPGVIAAVGLQFALYVVVHQGKGPIAALAESWKLTEGFKGTIFVLNILFVVLMVAVSCATLGMGLLLALPILSLAQAVMYHSLLHLKGYNPSLSA